MTYKLLTVNSIESTNAFALKICQCIGPSTPFVIHAKEQTNGYGTKGRTWESLEGNFFFSVILKGSLDMHLPLPYVVAKAVCLTLQSFAPNAGWQVKKPNDVLLNGKKIAGILIEFWSPFYVVGIGVNIKKAPFSYTTSLASLQKTLPTFETFLDTFFHNLKELNTNTLIKPS